MITVLCRSILRAPISVKILLLMYTFGFCGDLYYLLFRTGPVSETVLCLDIIWRGTMLFLILSRVSWTWVAGLVECFYYVVSSVYSLFISNSIPIHPTKPNHLTQEQMKMLTYIGGSIGLIIGTMISVFLWYKSKPYFQQSKPTDITP
jgi:hypothetical protein